MTPQNAAVAVAQISLFPAAIYFFLSWFHLRGFGRLDAKRRRSRLFGVCGSGQLGFGLPIFLVIQQAIHPKTHWGALAGVGILVYEIAFLIVGYLAGRLIALAFRLRQE